MRHTVWVVLCAAMVAACASSKNADCDPAVEPCTADAAPVADAPPDGPPLRGFGEVCTDRAQCESNLCILVGTSGQCTQTCGTCPDGYGCLGVVGIDIEGTVTFVCVPTSTQLCSTCTLDSECTLIGDDKCVTYGDGDRYCGQDCTTVACPAGFVCNTVNISGTNYQQCMASSGACDCTDANPGAMQPCNIVTPWNVCMGSQTCGGATGWGTCDPPSTIDEPESTYTDSNCDGIDGDVTRGIFVSPIGGDTPACGLVYSSPCQTISYGIVRAATAARTEVFVQTGTYNEVVVMVNGVDVWGGYDANWQRGAYSDPAHRVTVTGGLDDTTGGASEYLTVRAHGIFVPVTIDNLILQGPNAVGAGKSSYVVHVDGAAVSLTNVQITAGNGAAGAAGSAGTDAVSVSPAATGGAGGPGSEEITFCNDSSYGAGGSAAVNSCASSPSTRNMNAGSGGKGGEMDTSCPFSLNARPGGAGAGAAYTNGVSGTAGGGGPANAAGCNSGGGTPGGNGNAGFIANGTAGTAAAGAGTISGGYWRASDGSGGSTGQNGGGGGGGGGSGGCDDGTDARGAGGGAGGAGGCAARTGGGGGGGAGGSFGVFAVTSSNVTISGCALGRGVGGTGGVGGAGGQGQPGGTGGQGGSHQGSSAAGTGGAGAHGGHGGGGGGGGGGRSVGVVWTPGSTVTDNCTFNAGAAGAGGAGGTAPGDGNAGSAGTAGTLENRRACTSGASC